MVSRLDLFKESNLIGLFRLTSRMFAEGFFNCYLTPQQFNLLDFLLHHVKDPELRNKLWKSFINSSLSITFTNSPSDHNNSTNSQSTGTNTPTPYQKDVPVTADELYLKDGFSSARKLCSTVRYLLYEQAIDYYYMSAKQRNSKKFIFDSLEELFTEEATIQDGQTDTKDIEPTEKEKPVKNIREEEDDFDDDDDEDEEENKEKKNNDEEKKEDKKEDQVSNADKMDIDSSDLQLDVHFNDKGGASIKIESHLITRKPVFPTATEPISSTDEVIGAMVHPILGTASAIESNLEKQNELKLVKNFNKTYHTFENDLPNLVKRRKLERSNKQLEMSESNSRKEGADNGDSQSVNKLMSFGGAANLSLKNLLNRIEDNRDHLNLTDLELKNLIMDVRKNRSKWSSYNKIGQEELYEACEKVVLELRGYTEHSTAFLNRVSKREAPNYYQVIKHPMDLNTVMKKLKTFQYTNKKQFRMLLQCKRKQQH
ncbi:unnamed protein product [Ambrosiozyma monospora]|uniref:Unnamed protein product n=1 Tax=Ambrosiozyma monospora TaxID=43982 RepID=A0ACB5T3N1_AMBMO|nr:unnamed protein product [Ambrosiozyma monospora]